MKNLDLDNTHNLDESFSNISQENADSLAILATTIGGAIIQNRTTPKNDEEQHCGVRPLNANKSKLDSWNKCVDNYRASQVAINNSTKNNNTPVPEKSNTLLIVSIIAGVLLIGGGITAFVILRKKG